MCTYSFIVSFVLACLTAACPFTHRLRDYQSSHSLSVWFWWYWLAYFHSHLHIVIRGAMKSPVKLSIGPVSMSEPLVLQLESIELIVFSSFLFASVRKAEKDMCARNEWPMRSRIVICLAGWLLKRSTVVNVWFIDYQPCIVCILLIF